MIVLDPQELAHHPAVDTATGQVLEDKTIPVGSRGFGALVLWARGLDGERVWALEDCRHVSGALERFLIARGERVVRVSTRLMAGTRRSSRERGKSDQIDAISVARAALAAGIDALPTAALAGICGYWSITASVWFAPASDTPTRLWPLVPSLPRGHDGPRVTHMVMRP
jgi:hypothetical protein